MGKRLPPEDEVEPPLLKPEEVARRLACSVQTAKRIMAADHPIYLGRSVRWHPHQLDDFLARGGTARIRGGKR